MSELKKPSPSLYGYTENYLADLANYERACKELAVEALEWIAEPAEIELDYMELQEKARLAIAKIRESEK